MGDANYTFRLQNHTEQISVERFVLCFNFVCRNYDFDVENSKSNNASDFSTLAITMTMNDDSLFLSIQINI